MADASGPTREGAPLPRRRLLVAATNLLLVVLAILVALAAAEAAFRIAPASLLPAGAYGSGVRNPLLGMNVHGGPVIYKKVRYVERSANRDGFLDVDHDTAGPAAVTRVGFFGDSYVESMQVPLEQAFFRRLVPLLEGRVETFGFGISGWGTLHALRAFQTFGPRDHIDLAVYLFVENDLGDNDYQIAAHQGASGSRMPYADLAPDGGSYRVRWITEPGTEPFWYHGAKWLQVHSLLAHVVLDRYEALREQGVRMRVERKDVEMAGRAGAVPYSNDLPATWPADHARRVERLGALLLQEWRAAAAAGGADLLVLYVPRGEDQLRGTIPEEDTWLPWLRSTAADLGLTVVDPSAALRDRLRAGVAVYDDHWSPAGHEVVAEVLAAAIAPRLGPGRAPLP